MDVQAGTIAGDERKSARLAMRGGLTRSDRTLADFASARALLRGAGTRQAGFKADLVDKVGGSKGNSPVLYLEGEAHRRQRGATARFFAPKVVTTRYRALMETISDRLIADFRTDRRARLDAMSLALAVEVAADVLGLTESDPAGMAKRLDIFFSSPLATRQDPISRLLGAIMNPLRAMNFNRRDVLPAIRARRKAPKEDVISHLVASGYSNTEILTECITFGAAGMATTREFITMCAWHLFERDDLRRRFVDSEEAGKLAMLEELLRLEPVVGTLYRRVADAGEARVGGACPGEVIALDIRAANGDPVAAGACPHRIDVDRMSGGGGDPKAGGAMLSFGDGNHRCPGAQVALNETMIFLDRLLRVPGIRLERAPDMGWNALVTGYELRGAVIACD